MLRVGKMIEKANTFMQTNKVVQSLPRRLLFYFAPFIFLLAGGMSVVIGYLAGSAILMPFTHNPIRINDFIELLIFYILTAVPFTVFTYGIVRAEKSQFHTIVDNIRHMIVFYFLLVASIVQYHGIFYQAFLPVVDVNNDELIITIYTAQRTLTMLGISAIAIVSNFIVLYLFKKPKNKTA